MEVYNEKKQQSFKAIKVIPYLNGVEQTQGTTEVNISNYQKSVNILGSSADPEWQGWGWKNPLITCDIIGWKLMKLPKLIDIEFDRIDFVITTFDNYPNMELNIGHVVCDQEMFPTLIITKDGHLADEKCINYARFLKENNIPISGSVAYLTTSDTYLGYNGTELEGNAIAKEMYYNNLLEASAYNRDLKQYSYVRSIEYLENGEGGWSPQYIKNNCETNRPIISMSASVAYLDEIIVNSAKEVGFKIFRGSGNLETGGTSYLDSIDSVYYCGGLTNDIPSSISVDNYDSVVEGRINTGKQSIDNMIQRGECRAYLTHAEYEKDDAISIKRGSFADVLRPVLEYAVEKRNNGELMILTTRQFYELCCGL